MRSRRRISSNRKISGNRKNEKAAGKIPRRFLCAAIRREAGIAEIRMVSIVATDGINRVWLKTENGNLGWCVLSGKEELWKLLKFASAGKR